MVLVVRSYVAFQAFVGSSFKVTAKVYTMRRMRRHVFRKATYPIVDYSVSTSRRLFPRQPNGRKSPIFSPSGSTTFQGCLRVRIETTNAQTHHVNRYDSKPLLWGL